MELVVDVDGRVHRLSYGPSYLRRTWPPGHVDARMRQVSPAPSGSIVTCFACIYAWDRYEASQRNLILRGV